MATLFLITIEDSYTSPEKCGAGICSAPIFSILVFDQFALHTQGEFIDDRGRPHKPTLLQSARSLQICPAYYCRTQSRNNLLPPYEQHPRC